MYLWQAHQWPQFSYQQAVVEEPLSVVLNLQQKLTGRASELPAGLDQQAQMDALIQNALQTSQIEGELLNVGSVRSSVAKHLNLAQAGFNVVKLGKGTRQTESLVAMLCDATSDLKTPLSIGMLCRWQAALFPEPPLLRKIAIGELRGEATMQVVSEKSRQEIVHFEAPPRDVLEKEMEAFVSWFNDWPKGKKNRQFEHGILRAAIAHLWFLTLHPFEDGNGRVARALTDRALAQAEQTSIRFYSLSSAIEHNRKGYYDILENTQNCRTASQQKDEQSQADITEWLVWFLQVQAQALLQGIARIERVVNKTRFWQFHSQTILTERQLKVLNRLLDNADEEFLSGISASQYQSLAKVSKATATRDLVELLEKGCLQKMPGGGRSTRYCVVIL